MCELTEYPCLTFSLTFSNFSSRLGCACPGGESGTWKVSGVVLVVVVCGVVKVFGV